MDILNTKLISKFIGACLLFTQAVIGFANTNVDLFMKLSNTKVLAEEPATVFLKVGLLGNSPELKKNRAPINVAMVLDRSSSMQGDKLKQAKEAAIMFVDRLQEDDIFSLVTYHSTVEVIVPATKASDKEAIKKKIRKIKSRGNTALFAGVSKGAEEVRKFLSSQYVNRVVLLSDGMANVGPDSPDELGALGSSLIKKGISVTTIGLGLGYNEDLMYRLASSSDGGTFFAEQASDLAKVFEKELQSVTDVVASEVDLTITFLETFKPLRVLGDRAEIEGQRVNVRFNQLYNNWENYIIIEVQVPPGNNGERKLVSSATVSFTDLAASSKNSMQATVFIEYSDDNEVVQTALDKKVMVDAVALTAIDNNVRAIKLRDEGKVEEAEKVLSSNVDFLDQNNKALKSDKLTELKTRNSQDKEQIGKAASWNKQRKKMSTSNQNEVWRTREAISDG